MYESCVLTYLKETYLLPNLSEAFNNKLASNYHRGKSNRDRDNIHRFIKTKYEWVSADYIFRQSCMEQTKYMIEEGRYSAKEKTKETNSNGEGYYLDSDQLCYSK